MLLAAKYIYVAIAEGAQAGQFPPNRKAFSTTLYEGTEQVNPITTGIDNTSKSLVWIKSKSTFKHCLHSTEHNGRLVSSSNKAADPNESWLDFTNKGFTINQPIYIAENVSGDELVAWNFRAASKFFDVVTWDGTNSGSPWDNAEIPHSLGVSPGVIIAKRYSTSGSWYVGHKDITDKQLKLDEDTAAQKYLFDGELKGNENTFTADGSTLNISGSSYVAYLFADTPGLIKCGSYGNLTAGDFPYTVKTGFKVGWVLIKCTTNDSTDWVIYDAKRPDAKGGKILYPNLSNAEVDNTTTFEFSDSDGFILKGQSGLTGSASSREYIYVAIAEDAEADLALPTGVLTADADKDSKSMTLTDVTGIWGEGLTAVNTEEVTENAPCGDDIVFTSSKPETTSGTVTTWGAADWELTNKDTNDTQTASVTLKGNVEAEPGPTTFTLADDTNYSVRVQYSSADPAAGPSEWSDVNNFKTCGKGEGWSGVEAAEDNSWYSVTYGDEKFVAVSRDGTNRIMYADESNLDEWVAVKAPGDILWGNVAYGDGKFVAIANGDKFMHTTDPTDKDKWTLATVSSNSWSGIAYGGGKFVVTSIYSEFLVASDPAGPWTVNTSGLDDSPYKSITYGDGKFVATAYSGKHIAYASDPAGRWSTLTAPEDNRWQSVTYGNGKFVAVANSGNNCIMYADESNLNSWTTVKVPENNSWFSVTYGDGKFVAVSDSGTNRIMYADESDLDTWAEVAAPEDNAWRCITHGNGKFVAVAINGTKRVMYSSTGTGDPATTLFYDENNAEAVNDVILERRYGVDANDTNLRKQGIYPLTEQPTYAVDTYVKEGDAYNPVRDYSSEINAANAKVEALLARVQALEAEEEEGNGGGY